MSRLHDRAARRAGLKLFDFRTAPLCGRLTRRSRSGYRARRSSPMRGPAETEEFVTSGTRTRRSRAAGSPSTTNGSSDLDRSRADYKTNSLFELFRRAGFHADSGGARGKQRLRHARSGVAGNDDDWDAARLLIALEPVHGFETIYSWQAEIEDDDVEALLTRFLKRCFTIGSHLDVEAGALQDENIQIAAVWVILGDQRSSARRHVGRTYSTRAQI